MSIERQSGERIATSSRANVRRLALGRFLSFTGTIAAGTALNFTLYEQTGSAAWVALALLLTWGIMGFLGPVAGAVGDRFDRRRVMIVCETAAAACWFVAAIVADSPALLLGVAFASSFLESPFLPASSAAIPNIAGQQHLSWANSLVSIGRFGGLTIGPLVGGLLVTVGARWVFVANAISYLVSVLLVRSVRADFADPAREPEDGEHRGMAAGFRFIRRDRVLRQVLLSYFAFLIGMAGTLVADPVLSDEFGMGPFGYGLITTCWGGGTIVGAWLARQVREEQEGLWMVAFSGLVALTGFGVALSPWFWLVLVWVAAFGLADGPTQVVEQNLLQRRTPGRVRSRVMGAWESINHGALVISFLLGGVLVPLIGPRGAYAVGGVTGLVGTALLIPLLRWLPEARVVAEPARSAE